MGEKGVKGEKGEKGAGVAKVEGQNCKTNAKASIG